jgi:hypothetical protein
MNLEWCGRGQSYAVLKYFPNIYLDGQRKITKNLRHDAVGYFRPRIKPGTSQIQVPQYTGRLC